MEIRMRLAVAAVFVAFTAAADNWSFRASPQVTLGENITASLSINCNGFKCNDIIRCPESELCTSITLNTTAEQTVLFETHDVGHITLYVNCSNGRENLFAEVSIGRSNSLTILSAVVGWIYFAAWSISFYPQVVTNYQRKSVTGLNFDFIALNLMGFSFYSIFNICLYFIPAFQEAYKMRHPLSGIPVELNDVVFAVHAVAITLVTAAQCALYERGNQKLAYWSITFICLSLFVGAILLLLVGLQKFSKLDYIYYFSYIKLTITIIQYIPQAWFNFSRKSTIGWSIGNILLDLTGGLLSILQMILLSINFDEWSSIFGNPTKFGLGFFSVVFDVLFIAQHYVLYRHVPDGSTLILPNSTPANHGSDHFN